MSRYVDISELEIPEDDCCYTDLESFVETICESEYIDIVRCEECKYWKSTVQMPNGTEVKCLYGRKADDFCSYGEREGE